MEVIQISKNQPDNSTPLTLVIDSTRSPYRTPGYHQYGNGNKKGNRDSY